MLATGRHTAHSRSLPDIANTNSPTTQPVSAEDTRHVTMHSMSHGAEKSGVRCCERRRLLPLALENPRGYTVLAGSAS